MSLYNKIQQNVCAKNKQTRQEQRVPQCMNTITHCAGYFKCAHYILSTSLVAIIVHYADGMIHIVTVHWIEVIW